MLQSCSTIILINWRKISNYSKCFNWTKRLDIFSLELDERCLKQTSIFRKLQSHDPTRPALDPFLVVFNVEIAQRRKSQRKRGRCRTSRRHRHRSLLRRLPTFCRRKSLKSQGRLNQNIFFVLSETGHFSHLVSLFTKEIIVYLVHKT